MISDHTAFSEQVLKEIWLGCIEGFDDFMRMFLKETTPISFENCCLKVEAAPFVIGRFSDPDKKERLNRLLADYTGIPGATVEFVLRSTVSSEEPKQHSSVFPSVYINKSTAEKDNSSILSQFNPDTGTSVNADSRKVSQPSVTADNNADKISASSASVLSVKNVTDNYQESNLSSIMTFDTYVCGESNKLALGTAHLVAENPGTTRCNPVFFYSGVGLGKTHLMHAIGNYIIEHNPETHVLYISAQQFATSYVDHVRTNSMDKFHTKYRDNIDVLLIDDMQFMIDKDKTQEEFFHTFEALRGKNKQIVISSDRPPDQLPTITDRLRSRMKQGMLCPIGVPELETRIAILQQKAKQFNLNVPDDILNLIANSSYYANVRELEGALTGVVTTININREKMTLENAKAVLDSLQERQSEILSPETVIKVVCEYFKISEADLTGKKRNQTIAKPRQLAQYLLYNYAGMTQANIGKKFGCNHTTVIHSCDVIKQNEKDPYIKNSLTNLRDILKIR